MRHLIVNADDFGHSRGVTDGIVEAHANGILTSTSLMVDRPDAERAAERAREHPRLSIGLHVEADELDDPGELARALRAQLERFRALTGRDPTHLDSHHHAHTHGGRAAQFARVAGELSVPLRFDGAVAYLPGFWARDDEDVTDLGRVSREHLHALVRDHVGDGFTEIGCHPAYITDDLVSSYRDERAAELATLTAPGLGDEIAGLGVQLVSFAEWRELTR
jgi:predicted glycoside hydrolase/deacetylase ChbG (UPF0249 family)